MEVEEEELHNGIPTPSGSSEERPSRPSTPSTNLISEKMTKTDDEWWRPAHPPETYMWEEVRRERKKGGYPWTLLDNEEDDDANDYLDDNLYEPVNPPPLHETGSTATVREKTQTGSLDARIGIQIPPEIDIITSEGLDGLDQPDPHDFGMDGDKEWMQSDDEQTVPPSAMAKFTAGIRGEDDKGKSITFDPATKDPEEEEGGRQRSVSRGRSRSRSRSRSPNPREVRRAPSKFEVLRNKAADMKQKLTAKIALPVRPKLNQWEGMRSTKKKKKKATTPAPEEGAEGDQEVPQGEEEPMEIVSFDAEQPSTSKAMEVDEEAEAAKKEKEEAAAEEKLRKQKEQEELKQQQEEVKRQQAEEKKRQQEEKKREAEEKKREAEELKRQKAEEKQRAKEESDKKKAEEKAAKLKAQEEAKKAKLEEQLAKAKEAEEKEKKKNEELLRMREEEAAAKKEAQSKEDEGEAASPALPEEEQEQAQAPEPEVPTPTGTGSRRKKVKKFVQLPQLPKLPQLPHMDLEFKRKVIRRSKTPPARPTPPKAKRAASEETENQLAAQYAAEIEARKMEMEEEEEAEQMEVTRPIPKPVMSEPAILVTQPSNEPSEASGSHRALGSPASSSARGEDVDMRDVQELPGSSRQQQQQESIGTKERIGNFGKQLKGFGKKSTEIASKKSKSMGATMKVIGKDLQKFGAKTSERFQAHIEEIKAKQDAAKARAKEKAMEAEDAQQHVPPDVPEREFATEPRKKFRFRRRDDSQEEPDRSGLAVVEKIEKEPEQHQDVRDEEIVDRGQVLGDADRDWESPVDRVKSREMSEEVNDPSSRDSPPGSSVASSTFAPRGKQGVIEEIDSDEFFLREKGISEGEDEEEINRFLVEELRQAFRLQENALAGFDLPEAPQRPERQTRRKEKEEGQTYQTFPPERPKRKTPGYVSDYLKQQQSAEAEEQDQDQDMESTQEERGSCLEDIQEFGDDNVPSVSEELQTLEHDIQASPQEQTGREEQDDRGYEPVGEEPVKPTRTKKGKTKQMPRASTPLYYNTVGGNDWMREMEGQVLAAEEGEEQKAQNVELERSRSQNVNESEADNEDEEYIDEAGYALVDREGEAPSTTPRRKKKNGGSKSNSLKRDQQAPTDEARHSPRATHIVPPSRPQRTYSTLKPRRPPRQRATPSLSRSKGSPNVSRPSSAIGIQGRQDSGVLSVTSTSPSTISSKFWDRPLPAPPRPERSNTRLNDLDQSSLERAVGARHYANLSGQGGVAEEICRATNISVLGRMGDVNMAIQTDPVQEYENEVAGMSSPQADRRFQRQNEFLSAAAAGQGQPRAHSVGRDSAQSPSEFVFPRRLHLEELEVDVLRVNSQLSAKSITVENLQCPQMEVGSLTSLGSLTVSSIQTQTLNSDQVNCNRFSSDTADLPSIIPQSFYSLSSPTGEKREDLRHLPGKGYDDTESICPYKSFEEHSEHLKSFDQRSVESPSEDLFMAGGSVDFSLSPEHSIHDDSLGHSHEKPSITQEDQTTVLERTDHTSPTPLDDDIAHCSELQQDSGDHSGEFVSLPSSSSEGEQNEQILKGKLKTLPRTNAMLNLSEEENDHRRAPFPHAFRIAVLEEQSSEEKSEEIDLPEEPELKTTEAAPVLSGSLRLEYSRSPEAPSDLQVHHDIQVERQQKTPRRPSPSPQAPPTPPPRSVRFQQTRAEERKPESSSPSASKPSPSAKSFLRESQPSADLPMERLTVPKFDSTPSKEDNENLMEMGVRMGRTVLRITMRGLQAIIDYIDIATTDDPSKAEEQRAHMRVLLCILLVLIAGIIFTSNADVSFTPPKWEFFMPPPHLQ